MDYKCHICNCTLDPGEGRICDECKDTESKENQRKRLLDQMVKSANYTQISMEEFVK